MIHELKTWPAYFERLADGSKTFEIRRNDRGFQAGDTLRLREYDPAGDHDTCSDDGCGTRRYTGRLLIRRVGFVAAGSMFGLDLGEHVVLSLIGYSGVVSTAMPRSSAMIASAAAAVNP